MENTDNRNDYLPEIQESEAVQSSSENEITEAAPEVPAPETTTFDSCMSRATAAFEAGNFPEAIHFYTLATQLKPNATFVYYQMALCYEYSATAQSPNNAEFSSCINKAFEVAEEPQKQNLRRSLLDLTLGNPVKATTDESGRFLSLPDCSGFFSALYHRILMMDAAYIHVVAGETADTVRYVRELLSYTDYFKKNTYTFKDAQANAEGTYTIPKELVASVRSLAKKYQGEYAKLIAPRKAILQEEISVLKTKIKAVPFLYRFGRLFASLPVLILGLALLVPFLIEKNSLTWALLVAGIVILIAWIVFLLLSLLEKDGRGLRSLHKELKAKKTQLQELSTRND